MLGGVGLFHVCSWRACLKCCCSYRSGRFRWLQPFLGAKCERMMAAAVAVTAVAKKLKAKWTPELGQDLNAYHNLDAEVELTGLSAS